MIIIVNLGGIDIDEISETLTLNMYFNFGSFALHPFIIALLLHFVLSLHLFTALAFSDYCYE